MMHACPVNFIKVDETVIRLNAWLNLLLIGAYFYWEMPLFIVLLGVDYLLKQTCPKTSPLGLAAKGVGSLLRFKVRSVDSAPKRFASFLGFIMILAALALLQAAQPMAADLLILFFALCTFLEGAAGLCVGCLIYRFLPGRLKETLR